VISKYLDEANLIIANNKENDFFVHYDADIYSSILFVLTKMDAYHKSYYAILMSSLERSLMLYIHI